MRSPQALKPTLHLRLRVRFLLHAVWVETVLLIIIDVCNNILRLNVFLTQNLSAGAPFLLKLKCLSKESESFSVKVLNTSIYRCKRKKYIYICIFLCVCVQTSLQKVILLLIPIYFYDYYDIFFWTLNGYLKIKMLKMEILIFFQKFYLLTFAHHHSATCSTFKRLGYSQSPLSFMKHICSINKHS